jgi:hypothetical protein
MADSDTDVIKMIAQIELADAKNVVGRYIMGDNVTLDECKQAQAYLRFIEEQRKILRETPNRVSSNKEKA